jgi:hypothetical protein
MGLVNLNSEALAAPTPLVEGVELSRGAPVISGESFGTASQNLRLLMRNVGLCSRRETTTMGRHLLPRGGRFLPRLYSSPELKKYKRSAELLQQDDYICASCDGRETK